MYVVMWTGFYWYQTVWFKPISDIYLLRLNLFVYKKGFWIRLFLKTDDCLTHENLHNFSGIFLYDTRVFCRWKK